MEITNIELKNSQEMGKYIICNHSGGKREGRHVPTMFGQACFGRLFFTRLGRSGRQNVQMVRPTNTNLGWGMQLGQGAHTRNLKNRSLR